MDSIYLYMFCRGIEVNVCVYMYVANMTDCMRRARYDSDWCNDKDDEYLDDTATQTTFSEIQDIGWSKRGDPYDATAFCEKYMYMMYL